MFPYIPPESDHRLLTELVAMIARLHRAKVKLEVFRNENQHFTMEHDGRYKENKE